MSSDQPSHFLSSSESPLDLTVKRCDMDTTGNSHAYTGVPQYTPNMLTAYPPTNSEYGVHQVEPAPCGYYDPASQPYQSVYNADISPPPPTLTTSSTGIYQPPTVDGGPPPSTFYPSPPAQEYGSVSYDRDQSSSCILPKKRKNLWRPYDSRMAAGQGIRPDMDKDGDSHSDSGSNSSDQEFKTPAAPTDPMKKRKRNMLRYAEEQLENAKESIRMEESESCPSQTNLARSQGQAFPNASLTPQTNNISSFMTTQGQSSGNENTEDVISSFKKHDVFGWSLKLQKPPEEVITDVSSKNFDSNVCMDGDKTYIELQTVKTNSPDKLQNTNSVLSIPKAPKNVPGSPGNGKKATKKNDSPNKNEKQEVQNENESNSGGRVFIQRRDNVIESVDETKNVPEKEQTRTNISLIDLIEEIEADALKQQEALEDKQKKNSNVCKLLEQCNFVKLEALDYLMANVIIQDNGPTFKNKNATVQKMLKGDKIGCVNMLDVVELQVEIGLN